MWWSESGSMTAVLKSKYTEPVYPCEQAKGVTKSRRVSKLVTDLYLMKPYWERFNLDFKIWEMWPWMTNPKTSEILLSIIAMGSIIPNGRIFSFFLNRDSSYFLPNFWKCILNYIYINILEKRHKNFRASLHIKNNYTVKSDWFSWPQTFYIIMNIRIWNRNKE